MILEKNQTLTRTHPNYGDVKVEEIDNTHVRVRDENGVHFVKLTDVEKYFTRKEPDQIVRPDATHQNFDDPSRHNIAAAMNRPDRAAEFKDK